MSSKRRLGSSIAHWCSLVWMLSTRDQAASLSGHSSSVFTVVLLTFQSLDCELAVPLRPVTGFPGLRLLRGLRPALAPSVDDGPSRLPAWLAESKGMPRRFPRSPRTGRWGRCPTLPHQHRHEYAADIPRGLPADRRTRLRSRPS